MNELSKTVFGVIAALLVMSIGWLFSQASNNRDGITRNTVLIEQIYVNIDKIDDKLDELIKLTHEK